MTNSTEPAGGWIEWNGGDQPVPDGTLVEVRFRHKNTETGKFKSAGVYHWKHFGGGGDIIAYRAKLQEKAK